MKNKLWNIVQDKYSCEENKKYETIFALANGYRGLRGELEFSGIGEKGNYIAGVFDKSDAQVNQIVNCQDCLVFNIYIDGKLLDIDKCKILEFSRNLNMNDGILYTDMVLEDSRGKITNINSERFVSKSNVHRWGASYKIKPINYSGVIIIESEIDGTSTNSASFPMERTKHFSCAEAIDLKPGLTLSTLTNERKIQIVEMTTLKFLDSKNNNLKIDERKYSVFGELVREVYTFKVKENAEYNVIKYGVTYTSRDNDKDVINTCMKELNSYLYEGYKKERNNHIEYWKEIWKAIDITIEGDDEAQSGIRFNIFQLYSSAYEGDGKVSIAAKGLHGEGYKGHVFWDTEIFMMPFFVYTNPEVAKQLLMYRYNTLGGARANAKLNGYIGAQFPWESADDGSEVTPKWGFDYDGDPVRIWTGDEEFHINSDITFAVWEYYRATRDQKFLIDFGIEMFLDTARFWKSRVEYNEALNRYEINKVIGPDEFHEHVNNNVYTNYLAKWSLIKSVELAYWLRTEDRVAFDKLCSKLGINEESFEDWKDIAKKIYIPINVENDIIEQFEGYFDLKYLPITVHDNNNMPVWPELEGNKLCDTQLIKQADVIMLMLILGDEFSCDMKEKNYKYYENRTMHKSSLSPSMYSIMGLNVGDTENAYKYFMKTVFTDLEDNQGNSEFGIHAASTGGAWQSAIFGFGGFSVDHEERPNFKPWIPKHWSKMSYKIKWRGGILDIEITQDMVTFLSDKDISIRVYDLTVNLSLGEARSIATRYKKF
jgi:kojibiose phosphorylase